MPRGVSFGARGGREENRLWGGGGGKPWKDPNKDGVLEMCP